MTQTHGVLIANRGEIAVRILRTAAERGLRTVAVYTPEDREAPHVRLADQAHLLTGERGYRDGEQLVAVGVRAGCSVVHPGYGFLSENADFAAACAKAGLAFAGPPPELLRLFGDKSRTRQAAVEHGVPVLPATEGPTSLEQARVFAAPFLGGTDGGEEGGGLPAHDGVMVKALSGGGGRGIRAVHGMDALAWAYERCRSEALRAFGAGEVCVERLLPRAKHIEVQILGDGSGAVTHLWDRDCSVQRRHQKLIEVAPSPSLPERLRTRITEVAVEFARAVRYEGLGTFEFLVGLDVHGVPDAGELYFIETNPRLQVEHTVTEEITGVDLVEAQLRVALGESLAAQGLLQDAVPLPRGFAVQARVNLEETGPDGTPRATSGTLTAFEPPSGPGIRVDTYGRAGAVTTGRYDSLLAKVVAHAPRGGFGAAVARLDRALAEFTVEGPGTNTGLLRSVLARPVFAEGTFSTRLVDELQAGAPGGDDTAADSGTAAGAREAEGEGTADGVRDGDGVVRAHSSGTVVGIEAGAGDTVRAGGPLVVLEAMKMEHLLSAPADCVVRSVSAAVGDTVREGDPLAVLTLSGVPAEPAAGPADGPDPAAVRPDLAEVHQRHEQLLDTARPQAVERRRRTGRRTARENIADLCEADSFTEYGSLVLAGQRGRRSREDLIAATPADGMITGVGTVGGGRCAVLSYDYTVLAGTQGTFNHLKTDRMLKLAHRRRLPLVLFAEGGGGRPGDTDLGADLLSGLSVGTFAALGRLNGEVPTVGVVSGRCFAGNAALLGCCDVVIATKDATIGMGGPAMIEGGGLGQYLPEEVGPVSVQSPNGVVDVLVEDEAEAVAEARRYLSYFQGPSDSWDCPDQRLLRHVVPENRVRAYDVRQAVEGLADTGSVLELRREFGTGVVTALVRIEGRPMGLVASNPAHLGGAIDSDAADKMARFLRLCEVHGLPVVSLCDTPGFMVGPEAEKSATVRHFSRLFVGGAKLSVPLCTVVLRKAYGLGAMAMAGGSFRCPVATVAWPTGELGPMGLEGAVRLGYRRELDALTDPGERQRQYDSLLAAAYERGRALRTAEVFDLDDVIDPADTRRWILSALGGFGPAAGAPDSSGADGAHVRGGAGAGHGRGTAPHLDTW